MQLHFSIRTKFLFVLSLLLGVCITAYVLMAMYVFERDKRELVFDLNRSSVTNLASDIESQFRGISDKTELFAAQYVENHKKISTGLVTLLKRDPDLIFLAPLEAGELIDRVAYRDNSYFQTYGLQENYFSSLIQNQVKIPIESIERDGEALWNASIEKGPPIIGYGRSVTVEDGTQQSARQVLFVAFIKADRFVKNLSSSQLNEIFVVNRESNVLFHAGGADLTSVGSTLEDILQKAKRESIRTSVFSSRANNAGYLAAFSKALNEKIVVVSFVSEARAFSAVDQLIRRSLLFSLIVATLAFLAAILFSRSLTGPLEILMRGTERVAEGNLSTEIKVKSHDEISKLAGSFNVMMRDLKQSREQLEEINRDLEKKVEDRTRRLEEQNRAVQAAQEALLKTTRLASAGEVAGRAAHEVLNPLTGILTRLQKVQTRLNQNVTEEIHFLRQLKESWDKDSKAGGLQNLLTTWSAASEVHPGKTLWEEDLHNLSAVAENLDTERKSLFSDSEFLLSESQRINRIINRMRSLSFIKADKKPHHLHALLHECINIMGDLFYQEKIKVEEVFSARQDRVVVDKDEFIQTITNLLRNSLQAVTEKGLKNGLVRIRTREENSQLFIDIEDNGVGIHPDVQSKLFETHFSTKEPEEGTGIGLSIGRRFIRDFSGDIVLLNGGGQKDQLTVFRITLPLTTLPLHAEAS